MNYYNEHDPKAAAWLRELIKEGHIPNGTVDERSITEIQLGELAGYHQCHFFAGIGGWSLALHLAGWTGPCWTGSCPCQPYSSAGKGEGNKDPRNLWPAFFRLIAECRPDIVFGEQVESAIGHGWLDGVQADLEGEGYAVGHCVLGAHSVGAPHIRQRLYWVADSQRDAGRSWGIADESRGSDAEACARSSTEPGRCSVPGGLVLADSAGRDARQSPAAPAGHGCTIEPAGCSCGLGHTSLPEGARFGQQRKQLSGPADWDSFDLVPCRDGKSRRIESGTFPLAHGVPGRVGLLRGYGNAIVPQSAAEFIQAYCEAALQIL